ncbi:MAG: hypothetical protein U1E17_22895 [Geminicoccaceae bacterium]
MAKRWMILGGMAMAAASIVAAGAARAATIGERQILDGCEAGGGGADIHSLQSHYDSGRNEIVVTLRMCRAAKRNATYRVFLDHTAPFVGSAATCNTTADSVVVQGPGGHRGVGSSEIKGNLVRFVIPLAALHVGSPRAVPLIPLWATATLGRTVDRVPNRESGDGCEHPRARTETLVQARVAVTGIAFVSTYSFSGAIGPSARTAIAVADQTCQLQATNAGIADASGIHAWLTNLISSPSANIVDPNFGPIQTADGTVVAQSIAAFSGCGVGGNSCLSAPINKDVQGNVVTDDAVIWTGTLPDGTSGGGELASCNGWTSDLASDNGDGGNSFETNAGFTTGIEDSCDKTHHVMCLQFQ